MSEKSKIKFDYAQIGGVRLHYAKAGKGAKLVLLLHGFPEFWYSWRHQLEYLSDEYTVVAPDLRGYNWSDKPPRIEDYAIEKLADDVTGLIRHFGFEKAYLVGHDWGAGVAWATAMMHSEYIEKLVCMQVPPFSVWRKNHNFAQFRASWYMFFFQIPYLPEWFLRKDDYAFLVRTLKGLAADSKFISKEEIAEYKRAWSEPVALTSSINYYRANFYNLFLKGDKKSGKYKFKMPTMFIYGEKDGAVLPETVKNVGSVIDAPFREVRIPNSGHWVQLEATEIVNKSLREFFAE